MNQYLIITAGGKGTRVGGKVPKQFHSLASIPVLLHSLITFHKALPDVQIVVTLPEACNDLWATLIETHGNPVKHKVVTGGETRFHSVKIALESIPEQEGTVWIHDGARPLVSADLIERLYNKATGEDGVIPVIPPGDSIRLKKENGWQSHDRSKCGLVQTPQVFPLKKLKEAYKVPWNESFTDDAVVYENNGYKVECINGERNNLKITEEIDMVIAESILQEKSQPKSH